MGFADKCHLKIPFPSWAKDDGDPARDFENWKEVQRWADDFYTNCLPTDGVKFPFLVAASDAPQAYIDAADYTCDGSADEVQINQAIDDAGLVGADVWLSPGNFNIDDAKIDFDSGYVTLRGSGWLFAGTTLTLNSSLTALGFGEIIYMGGGAGIRDLYIDGQGVDLDWCILAQATSHIENVFIADFGDPTSTSGAEGIAIYVSGTTDSLITGCYIYHSAGNGIYAGQDCRVLGNFVENSGKNTSLTDRGRAGIRMDSSGIASGNIVNNASGMGILADGGEAVIAANDVSNPGKYGIMAESSLALIANNGISTGDSHGIYLDGAFSCLVAGNVIEYGEVNANVDGIHLTGNTDDNFITGNLVYAADKATDMRNGIRIDASTCDDNIVVGNNLAGSTFGTAPITDNGTNTLLNWPNDATYGDNFT